MKVEIDPVRFAWESLNRKTPFPMILSRWNCAWWLKAAAPKTSAISKAFSYELGTGKLSPFSVV